MIINTIKLSAAATLVALLTACASGPATWTAEQKAAITEVKVAPVGFDPDAYQGASAHNSNMSSHIYASDVGGLAVVAVFGIADGIANGVKQARYDSKNKDYIPVVKANMTDNDKNGALLNEAMMRQLSSIDFFKDKIKDDATQYTLKTQILSHGLSRVGNSPLDNMRLVYWVKSQVALYDRQADSSLFNEQVISSANLNPTIAELANDPALLERMKMQAYDALATSVKRSLSYRLIPRAK